MKKILPFCLALLAIFTPISAQDVPQMTTRMFSVATSFAHAPWAASGAIDMESEIYNDQGQWADGTQYLLLEMIPKGQSFDAWTQLYAITAQHSVGGEFQRYVDQQVGMFENTCTRVTAQFSKGMPEHTAVFVVFCEGYKSQTAVGEVAVFSMQLRNGTLIKNYYHRRVPAFELIAGQPLPLPKGDLMRYIATVAQLKLSDP